MRNLNSVRQLGKTSSHRKAMFSNMVTSFFLEERIITTKQKARELKRISEKMITRAKKSLLVPEDKKEIVLHNKREIMKMIKNEDAVSKLFKDIAVRNKQRNGGYTRIYILGRRAGDAAETVMIELVEKESAVNSK